jgi:hypothetical protein
VKHALHLTTACLAEQVKTYLLEYSQPANR